MRRVVVSDAQTQLGGGIATIADTVFVDFLVIRKRTVSIRGCLSGPVDTVFAVASLSAGAAVASVVAAVAAVAAVRAVPAASLAAVAAVAAAPASPRDGACTSVVVVHVIVPTLASPNIV